eukprot:gnl/TRDRNA2_/TRDRNA2_174385_c2_seq10.p1 gnl/TRDRNA2_/TRDRNA2_174385_c2~~gnl/TRDRNA2_/TRDRNA2_174385_c2_seq10.p1  ORF type:complete len:212 (+),score=48.22 gnl/TRDRNA2_/TRDRNA2_174385_c2_seq10:79-714(+)
MQTTLVLVALLASAQAIRAPTPVANATTLNSANSTGMSAYELLVKSIHDECKTLCLPDRDTCSQCDVDSHCVSECQVEMMRCHDHNHTTVAGKPLHDACTKAAAEKTKLLANPPPAPGPAPGPGPAPAKLLLLKNGRDDELGFITKAEMKRVEGMCRKACGSKVDSSCVPQCQVTIYNCMDANRKTEEGKKQYEMCEKAAMGHFKAFQNPR